MGRAGQKAVLLQTHQSWGGDSLDGNPGCRAQSPEVLVLHYKALTKEGTPVLDNCKENPRGNIVSAAGLITNVSKSGIGIVWGLI